MVEVTTASISTSSSALSLARLSCVLVFAYVGVVKLLPKTASRIDKLTFLWLVRSLNSMPLKGLRATTEDRIINERLP